MLELGTWRGGGPGVGDVGDGGPGARHGGMVAPELVMEGWRCWNWGHGGVVAPALGTWEMVALEFVMEGWWPWSLCVEG